MRVCLSSGWSKQIKSLKETVKLMISSGNQLKVKSELIVTCSCAFAALQLPHTDLF